MTITTPHPGDELTRRQRLMYIFVLGALTALGPLTVDLYLPAFPLLESDLGVSPAAIQLTLTGTMVGFGVGQLLVGPWSDSVGRRLPILLATLVHIVACVGAAMAVDIYWLGAFRILQGFGAAAGAVVAMAMVRDLFGGKPLVLMLSRLALITGLAPVLAPLIGSQMLLLVDWRGIFWALAAFGVIVVTAVWFLIVETLPPERRTLSGHSTVRQRYRVLLRDRTFVGTVVISGLTFSGLFAYLAASPFLFQEVFGLSAQEYGLLFATISIGVIIGVQSSSRVMRSGIGPQWILAVTTIGMMAMGITIVVLAETGGGFWSVAIPLWFFILFCGFSFPCMQVLALVNHGSEAGTAASLLGAFNFGVAGLLSPIVGLFGVGTAVPMGAMMAITAGCSIVILWFVVRPRTVPALLD